MAVLKLAPPWETFYRELNALFGSDPDISVIFDEDEPEIKLYVSDPTKADALAELLPSEKEFGNVVLKIVVIAPNGYQSKNVKSDLLLTAFNGNPALSYVKTVSGILSNDITYVVFQNEVVQYFNDSLSDVHGLCSTLYQDIAGHVLGEIDGVFYCTDIPSGYLPF